MAARNCESVKRLFLFVFVILPVFLPAQPAFTKYSSYLKDNKQLVFVTAKSWTSTSGKMQLYDRENNQSTWKLSREFDVVLGRNGLAPDPKSTLRRPPAIAVKKEGDGKSPAGIFRLGPVFSYHNINALKISFKKVDTNDICVDDVFSAYYNRLINSDTVAIKDWKSFERMKLSSDLYEYGVWVNYNSEEVFSGNGSCIFLHVWAGNTSTTSGCTAMEKQNIIKLIQWLDEKCYPVLLQLVED